MGKETGFTQVNNKILESIQNYKFTTNQLKIILVIWRYTFGYHRKEHEFAITFLELHTNLERKRVIESTNSLIESKVLSLVSQGGGRKSKILAFNEDIEEWKIGIYAVADKKASSGQNATSSSGQDDTSRGGQDDTQDIKKESIKKKRYISLPLDGSIFLNIYNQHFVNKFQKQHMKISEDKEQFILNQMQSIESEIDIEEFEEIVIDHFYKLPKTNNGSVLYFISTLQRSLKKLKTQEE